MANRTPRIVSHAGFPTDESLILTPSSRLHEQKSQRDCHSECDTAWAARTEDAARSAPSGVVDTQRFDSLQHGVNQIRRDNDLADRAWYACKCSSTLPVLPKAASPPTPCRMSV
jgi:hypothetical protein